MIYKILLLVLFLITINIAILKPVTLSYSSYEDHPSDEKNEKQEKKKKSQ